MDIDRILKLLTSIVKTMKQKIEDAKNDAVVDEMWPHFADEKAMLLWMQAGMKSVRDLIQ